MYLVAAGMLFAVFAVNVAIGSVHGAIFLGDVGEMLVLFGASLLFVIAVLRREAAERGKAKDSN